MEEDGRYVTERILDLTLEIISLLTGETFTAVKSGDLVAIMVPPFHFMMPEISDQQRLLELTNKMVELLTGESGIFGHCLVTDKKEVTGRSLGTKKSGHSGGHKAAMMEEEPAGSRIPLERSPHLLYSRDATQEAQEIPHHDQVEDVVVVKVVDTDDEEDTCMVDEQPPLTSLARTRNPKETSPSYLYSGDSVQETEEGPHHGEVCTAERHPHPLYSQHITQHHQELPQHLQREDLIVVKVGVKEEEGEPYAAGGQQSTEEVEIRLNVKVGEISAEDNPAQEDVTQKTSAARLASPPHYILEDDDDDDEEGLADPLPKMSCPVRRRTRVEGKDKFSCPECGKCLTSKYNLMIHQRVHTGERPFSCLECGRSFTRKENLQHHQKLHAGQKAFSCYKCGKCFVKPSGLIRHLKTHAVNRHKVKNASKGGLSFPHDHQVHNVQNSPGQVRAPPNTAEASPRRAHVAGQEAEKGQFSCPVCGKGFGSNFNLQVHKRVHTGERPFSCLDCGRTFTRKENLKRHQVTHSEVGGGGDPGRGAEEEEDALAVTQEVEGDAMRKFVCSECGKRFKAKSSLRMHWRHHIGDLPYSCRECGKRYAQKYALDRHAWLHTGERPFSCSECGKGFTRKSDLILHVRIHTAERPFSCSECGKGFIRNTELQKHLRVHTGERPFQCSACHRRFNWKADLAKHQKLYCLSERNLL